MSNSNEIYAQYQLTFHEGDMMSSKQIVDKSKDVNKGKKEYNHTALIARSPDPATFFAENFRMREDRFNKWFKSFSEESLVDIKQDIEMVTGIPVKKDIETMDLIKIAISLYREEIYKPILTDMLYSI
jgi:hypothetical protein